MIVSAGPAISAHRGNCTLVAMRQVTPASVTDEQIHAVATRHGFPTSRKGGMEWAQYWAACRALGMILTHVGDSEMMRAVGVGEARTTARIARAFSKGTYLVGVRGHTFAMRDGIVLDPNMRTLRSRAEVVALQRVENDGWVAPAQVGGLQVVRSANQAKRRGTATWKRFNEMHTFEHNRRLVGLITSEAEILSSTSYTRADLAYDLDHGHVVRV